ncbi:MAG: DUF87 domain-containing protein [Candidatus Lokiarchaeota archaeon]|nr:DUF87 domain-containing protein [Candidatus Lokiarchaeota archaeon]
MQKRFLGTVYKTFSNYSLKFSTKPGFNLKVGELVEFEINNEKQIGIIKSVERFNYLINQDEAVQLSTLFHEKPNLSAESIGIENNFDDFVVGEVEVVGKRNSGDKIFRRSPYPVKIGTKIYKADENFVKSQITPDKACVSIGNLRLDEDIDFFLDFNELLSKHFCVLAMTGAGKSWTVAVLVEQIAKKFDIPIVIFDPHGEYSSLLVKRKNSIIKAENDITNKVKVFTVAKEYISKSFDKMFFEKYKKERNSTRLTIDITDLETYQIISILNELFELSEAQSRILQAGWADVRKELRNSDSTDIDAILKRFRESEATISTAAKGILNTKFKLFVESASFLRKTIEQKAIQVQDIVKKGQISVIDLSGLQLLYQQTLVAVLAEKILEGRMNKKIPPVLSIFEEAHRFIPSGAVITASKKTLKKVAQEGRKFSMGLGIISQRPSRLDSDVLSQCNTQIILRLTNPKDQDYVRQISEYVTSSDLEELRTLIPGEAFVFGSATLISLPIKVKSDRFTEHGGYTPDILEALKKY